MELGSYLVDELGIQNSVDTLGRWLAHHVAQLIIEAQTAKSEQERGLASARAIDVILKIWKHRAVLPGQPDPMSQYRSVLPVLYKLRREASPWERHAGTNDPIETFITRIHRKVARLVAGLLLLRATEKRQNTSGHRKVVEKFLSKDEAAILGELGRWTDVLLSGTTTAAEKPVSLGDAVLKIIDDLASQLARVREVASKHALAKDTEASSHGPGAARSKQARHRRTKPGSPSN